MQVELSGTNLQLESEVLVACIEAAAIEKWIKFTISLMYIMWLAVKELHCTITASKSINKRKYMLESFLNSHQ